MAKGSFFSQNASVIVQDIGTDKDPNYAEAKRIRDELKERLDLLKKYNKDALKTNEEYQKALEKLENNYNKKTRKEQLEEYKKTLDTQIELAETKTEKLKAKTKK